MPDKAVTSLTERLETMWFTSELDISEKLKKGREILDGWEQYYRGERKINSMIEYVILLTMVQNKAPEILDDIEEKRFNQTNYCKDIAGYMADYWKRKGSPQNCIREYEQFFHVPDEDKVLPADKKNPQYMEELARCYAQMLIRPSEEICSDIMQIYTDLGAYGKASFFWEKKAEYVGKTQTESPDAAAALAAETAAGEENRASAPEVDFNIQDYLDLFVGRDDTYSMEMYGDGNKRMSEQVPEPLTEDVVRRHAAGDIIVGTYVQRPNSTAKYVVFDIDISKKILLQHDYGSPEFAAYKQNAAEYAAKLCRVLRRMGMTGYAEDSGFRGYHVWVFFDSWIPVRYINQFTDCVQKELGESSDGITVELFPNNARVRAGKHGQKIRLPLGVHIRTGNRSYFVDEAFHPVTDYKDYFSGIARYSLTAVRKVLGMYLSETKGPEEYKEVIRIWKNSERCRNPCASYLKSAV